MYTNGHFNDVVKYNLRASGENFKLSENFTLGEVACKSGSPIVLMHPLAVAMAQEIRDIISKKKKKSIPVSVNSGYREWLHHKATYKKIKKPVKKGSAHLFGMGLDLSVTPKLHKLLIEVAESLNPGGLGLYDTFIHVDLIGENRRWDNRT